MSHQSPRPTRLLSYAELLERGIPYTRQHLRRLMAGGEFPRAVQLSESRIAWLDHEIDAWIFERAAARPALTSEPADSPAPLAAAPREGGR